MEHLLTRVIQIHSNMPVGDKPHLPFTILALNYSSKRAVCFLARDLNRQRKCYLQVTITNASPFGTHKFQDSSYIETFWKNEPDIQS